MRNALKDAGRVKPYTARLVSRYDAPPPPPEMMEPPPPPQRPPPPPPPAYWQPEKVLPPTPQPAPPAPIPASKEDAQDCYRRRDYRCAALNYYGYLRLYPTESDTRAIYAIALTKSGQHRLAIPQ